jgi:hypothetical protein
VARIREGENYRASVTGAVYLPHQHSLRSLLYAPMLSAPNYCWKLVAEGLGQRRVSVVLLGVIPLPRKVQHSPSVEL